MRSIPGTITDRGFVERLEARQAAAEAAGKADPVVQAFVQGGAIEALARVDKALGWHEDAIGNPTVVEALRTAQAALAFVVDSLEES